MTVTGGLRWRILVEHSSNGRSRRRQGCGDRGRDWGGNGVSQIRDRGDGPGDMEGVGEEVEDGEE